MQTCINEVRHPTPAAPATLCVHFTRDWDEYNLWLAGADDARPTAFSRLRIAWHERPTGVLWAEVSNSHSTACDAILLDHRYTAATWQQIRDLLRAEGVPRQCAAILARLPERPLLATFARGPSMSTDMVRQIHRLLRAEMTPRP